MCTVGVKVTRIHKSVTENDFKQFLDAIHSLPPVCSVHLKDSSSHFKFAFVNFSSLSDAEKGVRAISGRILETQSLAAKIQDKSKPSTSTSVFQSLGNGIPINPSHDTNKFSLSHLKYDNRLLKRRSEISDDLPDYDDDDDNDCVMRSTKCIKKTHVNPSYSSKKQTAKSTQISQAKPFINTPGHKGLSTGLTLTIHSAHTHVKPLTPTQEQLFTPTSQNVTKVTKSFDFSQFSFFPKRSKLLQRIHDNEQLKVNVPDNSSKVIITGEKCHVDSILKILEDQFAMCKSQLKTTSVTTEAMYAPLFLNKQVVEDIKEIMTNCCVEFACTIQNDTSESLTIDSLSQVLQQKTSRKTNRAELLLLSDLYELNLLARANPNYQQWHIQKANGEWSVVPSQTNQLFVTQVLHPFHEIKEGEFTYKVDLQKKTAINTSTGFTHNLKVTDGTVWYRYQDAEFGYVPFSSHESNHIEKCYKSHITKPRNDGNQCCYYNFVSMVEIDTINKRLTNIKREPEPELYPTMIFTLCGMKDDVESANEKFHKLTQSHLVSLKPPKVNCSELFECYTQQYCMKVHVTTHSLHGVKHYISEAILQILSAMDQTFQINAEVGFPVPEEWEVPQEENIVVKSVQKGSAEWCHVENKWKETMSQPIKKIERIQNKWQWNHYCLSQRRIKDKNNGQDNELWLFHGTRYNKPSDIYTSEKGFDFRFSHAGLWGNGSYFAKNASYSLKYAFNLDKNNKQMFFARVITGISIKMSQDKTLRMPPCKCDGDRYDSVKGYVSGSDIYVVYEHDKSYPAYLITF